MKFYSPSLQHFLAEEFRADYENAGTWPADAYPITDEEELALRADSAPQPTDQEKKLAAIRALEATITPRRIREAVLGHEEWPDWLKNTNAQIAALRSS